MLRPRYPWRIRVGPLPALVAMLASVAPASATHLEAKMFVITDWIAECPANDLPDLDDMLDLWYDEIEKHGWYSKDGRKVNHAMNRDRFCDPDTGLAGCEDQNFLDDADAAIIGMHGTDLGNHWQGRLRRNGGVGVNDCNIDAPDGDGVNEEMFLGDVDLEFLHMSSCYSMDDDNVPYTWRMFEDPVDSPNNGQRLHQATGFHGIAWVGGCCDDQYEDFADDAFSISIKSAWMSNMYVTGIDDTWTQCPVAYAVGSTSSDCLNRLTSERYNNVFSDPGAVERYCISYYDGCDPKGEGPFTP